MKSFSELTSASQVNNADLLAISQTSGNGYASKKTTVKEIADKSNLNLAEEYDSTSTYAVDDYVIYESVLYKCIASTTGTFDSTKWTSVVVTDEMGSGGGGGTGGHTIIDENGNSMTARAGLQFVGADVSDDGTNDKTIVDLASAGGIDGFFIDTDNVIQVTTNIVSGTTASYTATEDCYVMLWAVAGNDTNVYAYIDNVEVVRLFQYSAGTVIQKYLLPLKKGQTFTATTSYSSVDSTYTVYGIQTGTTHSKFQPVIYSTEEREIGVWTDGKPLYQKTIVAVPTSTDYQISLSSLNIDNIVNGFGYWTRTNSNSDTQYPYGRTETPSYNSYDMNVRYTDEQKLRFIITTYSLSEIKEIRYTIQYTKTTDVAGSGSWTPQGVPAHHYSTNEQIVGTWIDGKTLYEKTITFSQIQSGANSWFNTGVDISSLNIDMFGDTKLLASSTGGNIIYDGISSRTNTNTLQCMHFRNANVNFIGAIVQYTKSS